MSGDFLSRWSRRKRETAARQEEAPAAERLGPAGPDSVSAACEPEEAGGTGEGQSPAALSPEEIAQLPPIEELTAETDLTPFLRRGVPNALRNAALRRMWSLDPSIRDFLSEAREYAYDWNTPGGVPGSGPLLPTDDVERALRQAIAASDRGEASTPEASAPAATSAATAAGPQDRGAGAPDRAGGAAPPAPGAVPPVGAALGDPPPLPDPSAPSGDARPRIRGRRHGGAVPT